MNKKQKQIVRSGLTTLDLQDKAMETCLNPPQVKSFSAKTTLLAVVTASMMATAKSWQDTRVVQLPDDVGEKDLKTIGDVFSTVKPSLVVSCFGTDDNQRFGDILGYFWMLEEFAQAGSTVVYFETQFNQRWNK